MKANDAIWGLLLIVLGVAIIGHVQSFPLIPGQKIGPAIFPGLVAAGLVVCGALLVVGGIRDRKHDGHPWWESADWITSPRHLAAFLVIIVGMVLYIYLGNAIGFLILAPIVLGGWFLVVGVRPATAAFAAIVATLAIWYVFYKLLRVPLPWGVLTPYAF